MKKKYTLVFTLVTTFLGFSQAYNGAGNDDLWSNTANWSNTTIVSTGEVLNIWNIPSAVDIDVAPPTVKYLTNLAARTIDFTVQSTNENALTIDNGSTVTNWSGNVANYGIRNQTTAKTLLKIDSKIIFSNTQNGFTVLRNDGHVENAIEMGENSELVLTGNGSAGLFSNGNVATRSFLFNGMISGSKIFSISPGNVVFGATSNNVNFEENISFLANANVTVNTDNVFLNGNWSNRLQANGDNVTITFNTPNTLINEVDLAVKAGLTFNVNFNANQNGLGLLRFLDAGTGTIKITVGTEVTELKFVGNQYQDWFSGAFQISGFKEGVFRFGTSDQGLTESQLSKISIIDGDHTGKEVSLDANGYLVLSTTLSSSQGGIEDFSIAPNPVKDVISIQTNEIISTIQVFDLVGNLVKVSHQKQFDVSGLASGVYIVKISNEKGQQGTQKIVIQ